LILEYNVADFPFVQMRSYVASREKKLEFVRPNQLNSKRAELKKWKEELERKKREKQRARWEASADGKKTLAVLEVEVRAERERHEQKLKEEQERKRKPAISTQQVSLSPFRFSTLNVPYFSGCPRNARFELTTRLGGCSVAAQTSRARQKQIHRREDTHVRTAAK
jgi:hypothetical protein